MGEISIQSLIHTIREHRVILDADLAKLYGVSTKRLKEQVKRNPGRFPGDFAFALTRQELTNLRSQIATSRWGGTRYLPLAFTEHGAIMAANVLNSARAVEMSVQVVRAFVRLREMITANTELAKRLDVVERRLARISHEHAPGFLATWVLARLAAQITATLREQSVFVRNPHGVTLEFCT